MMKIPKKIDAEKVFNSLIGTWEIKRKIYDKMQSKQEFFEGKAEFVEVDIDKLKYREDIIFYKGVNKLHLFREYFYNLSVGENSIEVYFSEKFSEKKNHNDGMKLFHLFDFKKENNIAIGHHLCKLDTYCGEFMFCDENNFQIIYNVNGSDKNYQIFSYFSKLV